MTDQPTIPAGEFYDCCDSEGLEHESPEEAVEEFLDAFMTPGCDVAAVIRKRAPVRIVAFRKRALAEEWLKRVARRCLDDAGEQFAEEYGDPEDMVSDGLDLAAHSDALQGMVAALRGLFKHARAFQCEEVGRAYLAAPAIEAMMREHRPEWFDVDKEEADNG
jgi:acyl carrier protein phosphodiesterase